MQHTERPRILTGLRANNDLTLGNYLGALLPIIDMAKKHASDYDINIFVPDLHSFTTPIDHKKLQEQIMQNLRVFVAAGLPIENENIFIYRQSYIPAHSELTWILDCFTGFGEMNRMTQFKDKRMINKDTAKDAQGRQRDKMHYFLEYVDFEKLRGKGIDNEYYDEFIDVMSKGLEANLYDKIASSVGLFNYPVLMAADVLLYNAHYVPVGEDQTQHLEFTRDISERMNAKFGPLFTVPETVSKQHKFFGKDQGLRIKDLQDPTKKMSKSDENGKGVIFLSDTPEVAYSKVKSATTDSIGRISRAVNQPGIANLLDIYQFLSHKTSEEVAHEWYGKTKYGDFKDMVAIVVSDFLFEFQKRLVEVDDSAILQKLESSEREMNKVANATLLRAQKAVGLR